MPKFEHIAAVILAGGESRRMLDVDKPLARLGNKALIQHCIERIRPQVKTVFLSVNGDKNRFTQFDLALVHDDIQPPCGPLGGLYSALNKAQQDTTRYEWLLCAPADAPYLPLDLCERLLQASTNSTSPVFACYGADQHYLCSLWPLSALEPLKCYLNDGRRSVKGLLKQLDAIECIFEINNKPKSKPAPFTNINTPDDLQRANMQITTKS